MRRLFGTSLALAAAAALALPRPSCAADQIVVRGGYGAPPAAEKALAKIAKESELPVRAGETPVAVARRICGRATDTYQALLRGANQNVRLTAVGVARTMNFPACFIVDPDQKTATRLANESLQDFALRVIGTNGPQTVKQLQTLNSTAPIAATGKSAKLAVPFTSAPVVYQLKPGAAVSAKVAAANVVQAFTQPVDPGGVAKADGSDLRPMSGIVNHAATRCDRTRTPIPDSAWPFDPAALLKALERNRAAREADHLPAAPTVVVAVADNGFDGLLGPDFPETALWTSIGDNPNTPEDDDGNGYDNDIHGITVFSNDPPRPVPAGGLPDRQHGTLIASLAIGGPAYRATVTGALGGRLKLLPISMVEKRVVQGPPNIVSYGYPSRGLREALDYAQKQGAQVLNLSVGTPAVVRDFEDLAAQNGTLVIVTAAGNEATDYGFVQLFPASYGGAGERLPGRVITVGASDRQACLADFSGRSVTTVDIAAPGVKVLAVSLNGAREAGDGTSQATGLVSFAVGYLKSEGLISPQAIKDRLYATVDRNPDLAPYVRSGGTLNLVKAISLHHDIWQRPDGLVTWGALAAPLKMADLCPQAGPDARGKILRLAWQGGAQPLLVLWRAQGGQRSEFTCKPVADLTSLSFVDEAGAATSIRLQEITSLVPR